MRKIFIATILTVFVPIADVFGQSMDAEALLAQKLEGTIYTAAHRQSIDSILDACGLEFIVFKRDFTTRKGQPVKMVGSFFLRRHPSSGLAYVLKLGLFEGFATKGGVAPANAFVRAPNGTAPKKPLRVDSDMPGFALFIGELDDAVLAVYSSILEHSELVVGFNRAPGQMDVTATVDLRVIDVQVKNGEVIRQYSEKPVSDFLACSGDLLKMVKLDPQKK